MNKLILAGALGAAVLLSGAAATAGAGDDKAAAPARKLDCFFSSQVTNFSASDEETLYLKAGRDTYKAEMFGRCLDMDSALGIALDSGPSSSICSAQDVRVVVQSSSMGPQRCAVKTLTKLTPEEVAALPKGDKP